MKIAEYIRKNRCCRKYVQNIGIKRDTLESLTDLARLSPSAQNLQPLKYFLSNDPKTNGKIFSHLAWAGYLEEWDGPADGERPAAYIIMLGDRSIGTSFGIDAGIASQSIRLGAVEKGLCSCVIAAIERDGLAKTLGIAEHFEIIMAIPLGVAGEKIVLEEYRGKNSIKYWRDGEGIHHVPKRLLSDIIIN